MVSMQNILFWLFSFSWLRKAKARSDGLGTCCMMLVIEPDIELRFGHGYLCLGGDCHCPTRRLGLFPSLRRLPRHSCSHIYLPLDRRLVPEHIRPYPVEPNRLVRVA